ncbi:MAG: diacylglycerol/lipid kinase family protein [Actinomycetota bacterium]
MGHTKPVAVLIVNPNAGRLGESRRADVIDALRARFRIEGYSTTARNSGITIASEAADAGARLVIAFGGDGHVNEVANGLAGSASALGIIPGGTMNVFARALGIPLDPLTALDHLEGALDADVVEVPLGKMDGRYFTFSAGCGFDAEAAQRVERYVPSKRRFGEVFFYWSAFRVLAGTYRHRKPTMTLRGNFGEVAVAMAVVCNAGPYAYIASRPVNLTPKVGLLGGIDVFALRSMRVESLPLYAWRVAVSGDLVHHPDAFYASDQDRFELVSEEPFHRHVDGEPLPPAHSVKFEVVPDILKVRA